MANNISHFEFSAYETGITKPAVGTKYTLNGVNNGNFKRYQDSYDDSPTNAFIIKTIVNYIVGDGLIDKSGKIKPHAFLSKNDLRLICHDFKLSGSAFPQIINLQQKPVKIKHTPILRVGLNINVDTKSRDYMDVNGYWYCWDYSQKGKFAPVFVDKFCSEENENTYEILHIKQLSSEPYFPFPDWFSGLKSAKVESALIDDAVNHITRGFQGKTVINVNNGAMMTEDEKEEVKIKIRDNWTGTENSDGVTISINESADEAIIVDTIEPRGRNEQFVTYDETAEIKLMAAHSAMNILFSRPGSNGFSNNAEEIATATDSLYLGVINPMREIILDGLNQIFKKIDPACNIDFINFGQENAIVSDVTSPIKMSSDLYYFGGPGSGRNPENGSVEDGGTYNTPNIKSEADNFKEGQDLQLGKIKTEEGKNLNPSLELALSIAGDSKIYENGSREFKKEFISKYGDSKSLNSVYFEKNGIEYRVSNHELPNRRFMEAHDFKNVDEAVKKGSDTKRLFHKNNVEVIIKDGKVAKINKNFNY